MREAEMKTLENLKHANHQEMQLLLPWYLNNTLQNDEKNLVESHLKQCLQCRAELVELRKMSDIVCESDSFSSSAHSSFAKLSARIQNPDALSLNEPNNNAKWCALKWPFISARNKRSLSGFSAFATAAIVLLAMTGLIHFYSLETAWNPSNQFRTLSSNRNANSLENEIRLVFSRSADQSKINNTLLSVNGEIISGPSQQGVYVIRIKNESINRQEISSLAAKLREEDHIIFAEPALSAHLQSQSG